MSGIRGKSGTRNSSAANAADTRVADVKADAATSVEATESAEVAAEDFSGIKSLKLFAEYVRNNIGKSGIHSARVGKGTRVKLDEMITREREADDATRALAIEIHKAVTGRNVRKSGYVQIQASEAARELIVRLSEERERQSGNEFVGIDRFKRWYATQEKKRKASGGNGGGTRLDVEGARAAAAAAIAAELAANESAAS